MMIIILEKKSEYLKLCYEYSYGFYWLLKTRSGYKLNVCVAKAAKIIDRLCPNYCPCCKRVNVKQLNTG